MKDSFQIIGFYSIGELLSLLKNWISDENKWRINKKFISNSVTKLNVTKVESDFNFVSLIFIVNLSFF